MAVSITAGDGLTAGGASRFLAAPEVTGGVCPLAAKQDFSCRVWQFFLGM